MKTKYSMPTKLTVALSMLAAISIILGKYLAFGIGEVLRFSFENLPVIFAGIAFGPIAGIAVGVSADLIGCVLVGYTINPLVTAGAALVGAASGIGYHLSTRLGIHSRPLRVAISVIAAHIIGSVVVKTLGLAIFYSMPIPVLMLWRMLNYLIIGILETAILIPLMQNRAILRQIGSMRKKTKGTGGKNEI